ncbi:antitoxin family protein [Methanocaldococcus sp.]
MSKIIEVIYEDGVLKPLKPLNIKDKKRLKIKIVNDDVEEFLKSMIIKKCKNIDYKKLNEAYYETI